MSPYLGRDRQRNFDHLPPIFGEIQLSLSQFLSAGFSLLCVFSSWVSNEGRGRGRRSGKVDRERERENECVGFYLNFLLKKNCFF